jgi:hypothetical protein
MATIPHKLYQLLRGRPAPTEKEEDSVHLILNAAVDRSRSREDQWLPPAFSRSMMEQSQCPLQQMPRSPHFSSLVRIIL